ncbi:hypothetical protein [Klebsiella pneumoniae]|uniref:hypothetical protein n=1 Tax=Klebsiella pneumoniae TaxID=573 RepID=UPI00203B8EE9|nr:hypothetical protein [Klebsiella pneumoniae]USB65956.1 hypothetical protein KU669_03615 [Klebsiella pneumoniae]
MRYASFVFIPLMAISSAAFCSNVINDISQVDGPFKATLTYKDDEPAWLGQISFNMLGSIKMICNINSMGGDDSFFSATYRCQNGYTVYLRKNNDADYLSFDVSAIDFSSGNEAPVDGMKYRVKTSKPISRIKDFAYAGRLFDRNQEYISKKKVITVLDACTSTISAHSAAATMALMGQNDHSATERVSSYISSLFPETKEEMAAFMIRKYFENKEQAKILTLPGTTSYMINDCIKSPENYIPDFGALVWSGKIFR